MKLDLIRLARLDGLRAVKYKVVTDYPTKVSFITVQSNSVHTRSVTNGLLKESGKTALTQGTLINDAIKAWNITSNEVKQSATYNIAKNNIKKFVKNLPT